MVELGVLPLGFLHSLYSLQISNVFIVPSVNLCVRRLCPVYHLKLDIELVLQKLHKICSSVSV